jgi:hypothetical protein
VARVAGSAGSFEVNLHDTSGPDMTKSESDDAT